MHQAHLQHLPYLLNETKCINCGIRKHTVAVQQQKLITRSAHEARKKLQKQAESVKRNAPKQLLAEYIADELLVFQCSGGILVCQLYHPLELVVGERLAHLLEDGVQFRAVNRPAAIFVK